VIVRSTPFGSEDLDAGPRLRVVGRHGVGVENIDVDAATARGVAVLNTAGANADSVAEFAVMTAMMGLRRLGEVRRAWTDGALEGGSFPGALTRRGLIGRDLAGRTVGILGFGAIGRRVAALCEAFGARVLFSDPFADPADPRSRTPEALFPEADVLFLHMPLLDETRGMIDDRALGALPPDAVVVNAARAEIVDAGSMLRALDAGVVAAYAVDVWSPEPPAADDPLVRHPRVIATPHMAAITADALAAMSDSVVEGVRAFLSDAPDRSPVNGKELS
ncbi:MAG: NAD(P)-dependent oxidoreductase, partial [Microbacterium sp.]